jgi:hypothetical protein
MGASCDTGELAVRDEDRENRYRRCVVIRESLIADVYALAAHLRPDDAAEVAGLGLDPRIGIRRSFRNAILRRTAFVDGEIAAMWGLCGALLSDVGYPYLMTTAAVEHVPIGMVKQARKAVNDMLLLRRRLEGHVAASYSGACGMLELIGFSLGEPHPMGPHGAMFRTFSIERT